jgi:assimilatory nitrate reductase catalytic subunit
MMAAGATRTTCAYCGVGCGLLATRQANGNVSIEGDPDHPANFGRLCSKGSALGETLRLEHRLLYPKVNGKRASWKDAVDLVARNFTDAIRNHGPDSIAFYVSGQLLTEDYYVANKLMKGYIGSANIDTNSRLCMASAVAGHRRAFGADVVPCNYADLELADLVVLVGSNLAWCHPVLFQRLMAAKEKRGTKIVVIDPRRTVTADSADLFLPLKPGTDAALFNGLCADLFRRGAANSRYVARHTAGLPEAMAEASGWTIEKTSQTTGLGRSLVRSFYELFAATPRVVTAFSMGVNQSSAGTDKVNAIINCHLLTGRIGKPGAGPFSITGQPNAMGGREVGGLANVLAAHMEIENPSHREIVQTHWNSPLVADKPGLKAVELFRAVKAGRIKALWIMATNPAVSMPDGSAIAEALETCPFVVVSDITAETETARYANVLLPAAGWGERSGTVTNSERRISRQRAFLPLPGEARPDWRIICDVARAMGYSGFDFDSPAAIFREYAGLTGKANRGSRLLDLSHFATLSDEAYETMKPYQWGGLRPFSDGRFQTPDRRGRFVATAYRPPASTVAPAAPLGLNTGRIRDQWHTMTRTGLSPRLFAHQAEPFVEINPEDAQELGLAVAGLAIVEAGDRRVVARVLHSDRMMPGQISVPMHWSGPFANEARANLLTLPNVDPLSGQPELKFAPVRVERFDASWYGFGVSLLRPRLATAYWSIAPLGRGYRFECAETADCSDWNRFVQLALGIGDEAPGLITFCDEAAGSFRCAAFRDDRLVGAFYASRGPVEVSRSWLSGELGRTGASRLEVLSGRPAHPTVDQGAIICACMNVGIRRIGAVARSHSACTIETIGRLTSAGTGCGACRPEIVKIIHENRKHLQAAE